MLLKKNTLLFGELVTFPHTLFVLPLIFSGYFIAIQEFYLLNFFLVLIASVSARTIGMLLNRIIDLKVDQLNPRTKSRPLPSGRVSMRLAKVYLCLSIIIFLVSSFLICDFLIYLALIPIVMFYIYPFTNKFTFLCHFFLGATLSLGPLAGGIAATCSLKSFFDTWPLAFFTLFWISGFDILYALKDYSHDIKEGIYSIPSFFGKKVSINISIYCFLLSLIFIFIYILKTGPTIFQFIIFSIISMGLFVQVYNSKKSDFSFFEYNSYIGFLILILIISDILLI